jgi:hypothetical protein
MSKAIDQLVANEELFFLNKLSPKQVQEWLERENGYNAFDAEVAKRVVETCLHLFPQGRFYVGRENSRVVYFDTGTQNYWHNIGSDTLKILLLELDTAANCIDEIKASSGIYFAHGGEAFPKEWLRKLVNVPSPIVRMWWD